MPSSSRLLVTLYSGDHGSAPDSPTLPTTSPLKKPPMDALQPERIRPNHGDPEDDDDSRMDATTATGSEVASSSNLSRQSTAPFLEMEEEDEHDEEYHDAMLEDIPVNAVNDIFEERNLPLTTTTATTTTTYPRLKPRESADEEETKEETGSKSPPSALAKSMARGLCENHGISCGKRPRNNRKVSFPPSTGCSLETTHYTSAHTPAPVPLNELEDDSDDPSGYNSTSLVRMRATIHLSEYTKAERLATWYTVSDLKSFKRERKETARRVDNGMLLLRPLSRTDPNNNNTPGGDVCVDRTSYSESTVFCTRGVENCTEAVSRIRYRHIADAWRSVLNTQEKHYYRQPVRQQNHHYRAALALSFLGVVSGDHNKAQKKSSQHPSWFSKHAQEADHLPGRIPCCALELAEAYQPYSRASLEIARNRAIGDEREARSFHDNGSETAASAALPHHELFRRTYALPRTSPAVFWRKPVAATFEPNRNGSRPDEGQLEFETPCDYEATAVERLPLPRIDDSIRIVDV